MAKSTGCCMNGTMLYKVNCRKCKHFVKIKNKKGKVIYSKCNKGNKTSKTPIICKKYERKDIDIEQSPVRIGRYLPDGTFEYLDSDE